MSTTVSRTTPASGVEILEWNLTDNETGDAAVVPYYPERTVQVGGSLGGSTVDLKGKITGAAAGFALTDFQGNALSFVSAGGDAIGPVVNEIWPEVTGGTGSAIKIQVLLQRVGA